uniref:Uncharacterized protein n=1 Tax=Ditylenchus dipsaci TaxID=166011 RepID=A0A915DRY8_9BILA
MPACCSPLAASACRTVCGQGTRLPSKAACAMERNPEACAELARLLAGLGETERSNQLSRRPWPARRTPAGVAAARRRTRLTYRKARGKARALGLVIYLPLHAEYAFPVLSRLLSNRRKFLRVSATCRCCSALKQSPSFLYRSRPHSHPGPSPPMLLARLRTLFLPACLAALAVLAASFQLDNMLGWCHAVALEPAVAASPVCPAEPGERAAGTACTWPAALRMGDVGLLTGRAALAAPAGLAAGC